MKTVGVHLKDYAGRNFGGDFEVTGISSENGKILVELLYCGKKASKRLSVARLSLDPTLFAKLATTS